MKVITRMAVLGLALFLTGCKTVHEVETAKRDIHKAIETWRNDVEPRLAEIEKTVKRLEAAAMADYKKVMLVWHNDIETHLSELERLAGTADADYKKFAKTYDGLKAGIRSAPLRVADDVAHSAVAKHVESMVGHVERLEKQHIAGLTKAAIAGVRSDIEGGVRKALKAL